MVSSEGSTLFWHRRDLRTVDNRGLEVAADEGRVIPIFVLDPDLLSIAGATRTAFFRDSLAVLQERYRSMGSDLLVRVGDPEVLVPEVAGEFSATRIVWNQDHSRYATQRDLSVINTLEDASVRIREVQDMTLHEPGSILTSAGEHYSVFSYYHKKWADRDHDEPSSEVDPAALATIEGPTVGSVREWDTDEPPIATGREAAQTRLDRFLDGPIYEYADQREIPAAEGTSRLSQDLKFGLLGIREVFAATERATGSAPDDAARESVEAFQRQLAWRDFYIQVLAAHPETVWENFSDYPNPIEWRSDDAAYEAWKAGETGYPIVDAGMRQLQAEGHMHNRVRMIVASFLTKDLLIDWRKGYRWFRERLVDHETANDVGGWQWAASTGTDAQPYFRVFNPMTQGERYDPEAEYISEYVPELAGVDPALVHAWNDLDQDRRETVAPAYPAPIVDHSARREAAIELFERARGTE